MTTNKNIKKIFKSKKRLSARSKTGVNIKRKLKSRRRLLGGTKPEHFKWNLGLFVINKVKGLINDDYWIEYPNDPLPEGWTLIRAPTRYHDSIMPYYYYSKEDLKRDMYQYYLERPIVDSDSKLIIGPKVEDEQKNKYFSILRHTEWKKLGQLSDRISGLKNFLKSCFAKNEKRFIEEGIFKLQKTWKEKEATFTTRQPFAAWEEWIVNPKAEYIYDTIINFNEVDVPVEFKKLYKEVCNWKLGEKTITVIRIGETALVPK